MAKYVNSSSSREKKMPLSTVQQKSQEREISSSMSLIGLLWVTCLFLTYRSGQVNVMLWLATLDQIPAPKKPGWGLVSPEPRTENEGRQMFLREIWKPFVNGSRQKQDVQYSTFLISVYSVNELTDEWANKFCGWFCERVPMISGVGFNRWSLCERALKSSHVRMTLS